MVQLVVDKPYTVHCRSLDRVGNGQTPSSYTLNLRDPIKCADDHYIRCTLVSCRMPSTFYQVDKFNQEFTVKFNQMDFGIYKQYSSIPVATGDQIDDKADRADYGREVTVTIKKGNYNITELMNEVRDKLNAACTAAHATKPIRTFLRGPVTTNTLFIQDKADSTDNTIVKPHIDTAPQFQWYYDKALSKIQLMRTDNGGKMALASRYQCGPAGY